MNFVKRLSMFLVLLLAVVTVYAGGISTAKEFMAFAKAVNNGEDISQWRNEAGAICLECDIDMKKAKKWIPIKEFKGTFDGKGFALLNWKTKQGLFDLVAEGGVVKNLRIDNSCVMTVVHSEEVISGYIARVNKGTIVNCENNGIVNYKGAYTEKHVYVGGLVGQNGYVVRDCRNNGAISAEILAVSANKSVSISVGGVVASTVPKGNRNITVFRCENTGAITYRGDLPRTYIGGVVGYSGRAGVRLCVNKANLTATSLVGNPEARGYCNVGGVVSQSNQHVQNCDNFGTINVSGTHIAYVGGICATVNASRNILGCQNYGNIFSSCANSSILGGVLGSAGDGARFCNCNNYGVVRFNGTGCKSGLYLGGVAGYVFSKNKLKYGSRFRRCNNFGEVVCDIAGKNVHAGGVAGRTRGTKIAPIFFVDCANRGKIDAADCYVGEVVARPAHTTIDGDFFDNNVAQPLSAMVDGHNIVGTVKTVAGEPVVGAVVTDGEFCVETDANGEYRIKSDFARARFVTISIPSDYKLSFRKSVPQNFLRIPRHAKGVKADFVLEKREKSTEKYTVAMIGDPQIKGVGVDSASYKLQNTIYPDIVSLMKSKADEGEFFAINLGDLVFNDMTKMDDYLNTIAESQVPMFHAIGNHDYDQTTFLDSSLGTMHFEEYLTPSYYSFNIGKVHYVIVNDISFARKLVKQKYRLGLEYWHYKWLERDLKFVPKDHTIVICGHAQLFRHFGKKDPDGKNNLSYARYSKLLSQYARVYSWSGHYHYNFGYDYADSNLESLKNVTSICVARTCGGLHCNRDLYNDGTPNGYMVMEVDGENIEWYYKSVGQNRDYQMHVYAPTRTGGELVKVNIWNWSKNYWGEPEWWENGAKIGNMTHKFEKDIAFLEDHAQRGPHILGGRDKSDKARPYNAHGMFHIKPSEGVRCGEVRVTDNFGRMYIQKVEW